MMIVFVYILIKIKIIVQISNIYLQISTTLN